VTLSDFTLMYLGRYFKGSGQRKLEVIQITRSDGKKLETTCNNGVSD